jgi:hypothetical protein
MEQLDGEVTRNKVLHSDGMVYNFDKKTLHRVKPQDRMGGRLRCSSKAWEAPAAVAKEAASVFDQTVEFCRSGRQAVDEKLSDTLELLSEHCTVLAVLHKFAGTWDGVLWLLRSMSRCAGGSARFCEFLYMYGPGSSGKDVVMLMFLQFFGEQDENLGCNLNGTFLVETRGASNKEGASPFLAKTQGKRFVWASEVPEHNNLQIDLIKQFCEQNGAPMTCRKLFQAPTTFRPIGMLVATSNYTVNITNKDDDGFHRRARIWQTTQTFRAKPTKETEHQADDTLKERILKGEFNAQLVWLLRGLWASLEHTINPGTMVAPIPEFMTEMEDISASGGSQDQLREWIATRCNPVRRNDATKITAFRTAAAAALKVSMMQIGPILTAAGILGVPNAKNEKVAIGPHPRWSPSRAKHLPGLFVIVD